MRNPPKLLLAIIMLGAMAAGAQAYDAGDPAKGKNLVRDKCIVCHQVNRQSGGETGPPLIGIIGRPAGAAKGYGSSDLSKAAGEAGLVWTEESIAQFLFDPKRYVSNFLARAGKADRATDNFKMPLSYKNKEENRHIAAYLRSLSGS